MSQIHAAGAYRIPCKRCNLVFIGEIGRNLETRIKQHTVSMRLGLVTRKMLSLIMSLLLTKRVTGIPVS